MSDDSAADAITTSTEFEAALGWLLTAAERNDINPRGSWVYDNEDESLANWEVESYELQ